MGLSDANTRHRILANGPVGHWRTVPGTHTALLDESIRFDPDGTGMMRSRTVPQGESSHRFSWRVAGYGEIECQPVVDPPELDGNGEPEVADWIRVPFLIEQHPTDTGLYWVLHKRGREGFWDVPHPVVPDD